MLLFLTRFKFSILITLLFVVSASSSYSTTSNKTCYGSFKPFSSNNGVIPTKQQWPGQLYKANTNYPKKKPVTKNFPWQKSINNKLISADNSKIYLAALKKHVSKLGMKTLVNNKNKFDANKTGWFTMPWRGQTMGNYSGQEAISGTYAGQLIPKSTFNGVKSDHENHTLVYFNHYGAYTLGQVFKDACNPGLSNNQTQFEEGTIIIKIAVVTITPKELPALRNTTQWKVFRPKIGSESKVPVVKNTHLIQFDIVVKDSQSSPQTGWVFSAFLYDANARGTTVFDRLIPLGATWGNSPDKPAVKYLDYSLPFREFIKRYPNTIADEEWINPYWLKDSSPSYATKQLGWGYRLAGPVDRARVTSAYELPLGLTNGKLKRPRVSSCLSCHGSAMVTLDNSNAFIPPSSLYPSPYWKSDPMPIFKINSNEWNIWYENRSGEIPLGGKRPGVVSTDFSTLLMIAIDLQKGAKSSKKQPKIHHLKLFQR